MQEAPVCGCHPRILSLVRFNAGIGTLRFLVAPRSHGSVVFLRVYQPTRLGVGFLQVLETGLPNGSMAVVHPRQPLTCDK